MSVIRLTGVLEDGSGPRAPRLPRDTSTTIRLTRYESASVDIDVLRPNGVELDFERDFTVWSSMLAVSPTREVACSGAAAPVILTGTGVPSVGRNRVRFTFSQSNWRTLEPRRWFFEVVVRGGDTAQTQSQWSVVRLGVLVVSPGLVRW